MDHERSGTLSSSMFLLLSFLVETCQKVTMASIVLSFPQFNKIGVIQLKLVITRLVDIKINIKIFTPIVSPATVPESLLVFVNAHRKNSQVHEYCCSFHLGVFQSIVFIHRKTMVKEVDNSPSCIY